MIWSSFKKDLSVIQWLSCILQRSERITISLDIYTGKYPTHSFSSNRYIDPNVYRRASNPVNWSLSGEAVLIPTGISSSPTRATHLHSYTLLININVNMVIDSDACGWSDCACQFDWPYKCLRTLTGKAIQSAGESRAGASDGFINQWNCWVTFFYISRI